MRPIKPTLILAALLCAPAAHAAPAAYQSEVMDCAREEAQLFFHYLKPDAGPKIKEHTRACDGKKSTIAMPDWLGATVLKMSEHSVWRDPEAGELSEAALWQAPAASFYEFAELTQKSPLPEKGYGDILLRFGMALDHIEKSKLEGSFAGRGAGVLAAFNRAYEQLDILADASPASDMEAFRKASDEAARQMRDAFAQLFSAPRTGADVSFRHVSLRVPPGYRGVSLPVPGHQLAFIKKGDRADVLVTFEAQMFDKRREKVTATVLQNVLVADVFKPTLPEENGVVELLLNPTEAQYAALSHTQGAIFIVARATGDMEMAPMEMAVFRKLFK